MVALAFAICLVVAAPPPAEVQREFEALWAVAQHPERIGDDGSFIEFDSVDRHCPAPPELAKLREDVRTHPRHPERLALERYERIARGDFPVTRIKIWKHRGSYRLSANTSNGKDYDRALDDGRNLGWEWSHGDTKQLAVFPMGDGIPTGRDFRPQMHDMFTKAGAFATHGLSLAIAADSARPALDEYAPGLVRATAPHPAGRMVIEGSVADGHLWLSSIRWESDAGGELGRVTLERDGDRIAVVRRSTPEKEYRWRGEGSASAAEIARLIAVPEIGVADPIRGPAEIRSLDDSRGAERIRARIDPGTGAQTVLMKTPAKGALQRDYFWAMSAGAAAILAAMVVVALRRRQLRSAP